MTAAAVLANLAPSSGTRAPRIDATAAENAAPAGGPSFASLGRLPLPRTAQQAEAPAGVVSAPVPSAAIPTADLTRWPFPTSVPPVSNVPASNQEETVPSAVPVSFVIEVSSTATDSVGGTLAEFFPDAPAPAGATGDSESEPLPITFSAVCLACQPPPVPWPETENAGAATGELKSSPLSVGSRSELIPPAYPWSRVETSGPESNLATIRSAGSGSGIETRSDAMENTPDAALPSPVSAAEASPATPKNSGLVIGSPSSPATSVPETNVSPQESAEVSDEPINIAARTASGAELRRTDLAAQVAPSEPVADRAAFRESTNSPPPQPERHQSVAALADQSSPLPRTAALHAANDVRPDAEAVAVPTTSPPPVPNAAERSSRPSTRTSATLSARPSPETSAEPRPGESVQPPSSIAAAGRAAQPFVVESRAPIIEVNDVASDAAVDDPSLPASRQVMKSSHLIPSATAGTAGIDSPEGAVPHESLGRPSAAAVHDIPRHAQAALRAAAGFDRPIRIQLSPSELGTMQVEVSRHESGLSARFEVTTALARSVLTDHLSSMRESLAATGLTVDRIEIRLAEPQPQRGEETSDLPGDGQNSGSQQNEDDHRQQQFEGDGRRFESRDESRRDKAKPSSRPVAGARARETDLIDIQV